MKFKPKRQRNSARKGVRSVPLPPISDLRCNPLVFFLRTNEVDAWSPIYLIMQEKVLTIIKIQSYSTFDDALQVISAKSEGALMAKMDVSNAFRLLPICPKDFCLLGFKILDSYYIDKCLSMGCSISCSYLAHYLKSFQLFFIGKCSIDRIFRINSLFVVGNKFTDECQILMHCFQQLCQELGVSLAVEKNWRSKYTYLFFGFGYWHLVSGVFLIFILEDKIRELLSEIHNDLECTKVTLKRYNL